MPGHFTLIGKGDYLPFQFQASKGLISKVCGHIIQWSSQQEQVHPHRAYRSEITMPTMESVPLKYSGDAYYILSKHFRGLDGELIDMQYKKYLVGAISKLKFPPGLIPT